MPDGHRILVLEDEALIALDLAATLEDAGWQVIGPAGSLAAARSFMDAGDPDLACLDLNIGSETSHDLARDLLARGVPVVFVSGRDARALPEDLRSVPVLGKPVRTSALLATLAESLRNGSPAR
jgi:DNA-binding response OmpR family regulator